MIGFLAEGGTTPPPAQNNFGDTMGDGIAGPLALLIIVLLAVATILLIRNMNARLRRLPDRFPDPRYPDEPAAGSTSDESPASGDDRIDGGVPTGPAGPSGS